MLCGVWRTTVLIVWHSLLHILQYSWEVYLLPPPTCSIFSSPISYSSSSMPVCRFFFPLTSCLSVLSWSLLHFTTIHFTYNLEELLLFFFFFPCLLKVSYEMLTIFRIWRFYFIFVFYEVILLTYQILENWFFMKETTIQWTCWFLSLLIIRFSYNTIHLLYLLFRLQKSRYNYLKYIINMNLYVLGISPLLFHP